MTIFQRIKHNSFFGFFIFTCSVFLTLSSCKKDLTSLIGGGLQPDDEFIYAVFNDTDESLNLIAYTIADVPNVTSGQNRYALGSYKDETFGMIRVDLISQLDEYILSDTVDQIFDIDSVILVLVYHSAYPFDPNSLMDPFTISIGELLEPVWSGPESLNAVYYSNDFRHQKNGGGTVLSNWTVYPNLRDSIVDPNDTTGETKIHIPFLRIPIYADDNKDPRGKDFAQRLLEASRRTQAIDSGRTNEFLSEITGLYIEAHPETENGKGSIINFDFSGSRLRPGIQVFYRKTAEDTASSIKDYVLDFPRSMTYNYIEIDRSTQSANLANQINKTDTALGQEMVFLQSFYGSLVRVEMPNIREIAKLAGDNHRMVINQASLVLNTSPNGPAGRFTPSPSINVNHLETFDTTINEIDRQLWRIRNIRDHQLETGGRYNSNRQEYRIFLTRHIQNLLLNPDAENFPLTIHSDSRFVFPDITSIFGPGLPLDDPRRMRLEIVYSLLPKD